MSRPRIRPDDLVGLKEAARILGWPTRKATTYRCRGLLPPPLVTLACGPVWWREDIEAYAAQVRAGKLKCEPGQVVNDNTAGAREADRRGRAARGRRSGKVPRRAPPR